MTKRRPPYSPEVRERAVRMVLEHQGEHASQWAAIARSRRRSAARRDAAAAGCGRPSATRACGPGRRRDGAGADQGAGAGDPRAAPGQRDPAQGLGVFCPGGARPPVQAMIAFIDEHRDVYGVEPICRVLPIAPSTYHAHAARRADPEPQTGPRNAGRRPEPARSGGCARRTSGSTACARSGGSCGAKGSRWPAARSRG